ncbi:MAG: zf-HC2 domain-containing protein [Candidatus Eiseniibacteriota bacterium]|nr:MAG: zf-HC2 domain-containing protein [Candidatus Eisenbacteria bacterium]
MTERCSEMLELLESFLDGDLPSKQEALVREHLRECSACRLQAEAGRGVVNALRTLPEARCSRETLRIIEEVTARKEARGKTLEGWRYSPRLSLWKGVVVGAAAMALLLLLYQHFDRRPPSTPEYTSQQALEVRALARDGLVQVVGVINRSQRKAVRGFLREDFPKTVRKSIRNAAPFFEGGKV